MGHRTFSALLGTAGALGALVLTCAPASAASIGPPVGTFTIDASSGPPTSKVTLTSVTPCPDGGVGALPTVSWTGTPSGTAAVLSPTLTAAGDWTALYNIPASEPAGAGTFSAVCSYTPPRGSAITTVAYRPVTFTVAGTAPTTSTSTTSTSTSTTSTSTTSSTTTTIMATTTTLAPPSLDVQAGAVEQGTITFTTKGWMPGATVEVTIESDPTRLGSLVADSAGVATGKFSLPANITAGNHTLKLTGTGIAGNVQVLSAAVTIGSKVAVETTASLIVLTTAPRVAASSGPLPATGSTPTGPTVIGALLVVTGALLVARSRRAQTR